MGHVGQEFRFDAAGFQGFLAGEIEFDVLDFDGFQGFSQVFRGLVNVLLHFRLGFAQFPGHGVQARFQLLEFRAGAGIDPSVQFAFLEFGHRLIEFKDRIGKRAAHA